MKRTIFCYAVARLSGSVLLAALAVTVAACGSSSGQNNPPLPVIDIQTEGQLVDVGQQYQLDASGSYDPDGSTDLTYFWTLLTPPGSHAHIQDHCEDDSGQTCTHNYSACASDTTQICITNSDCDPNIECVADSATTSPDCTTGACGVGDGQDSAVVTFVADTPGPFVARVLVSTTDANNTGSVQLNTYPSLFLIRSLWGFGGTEGALVAEYADALTYAPTAVAIAARPLLGTLLLAVAAQPELGQPGRIGEFSARDGRYKGLFGETSSFVTSPVAMTLDATGRLYVANSGGVVQLFDEQGRFIRDLGNVAAALEQVAAIAISPVSGDLLVVDGQPGQPVRSYNAANGSPLGVFGTIETVASQAIDLAFLGDALSTLYVADAGGALLRCKSDGTACAALAAATPLLASGGPTSVAVNPAADATTAQVLVADAVNKHVVACSADGATCEVFGETADVVSDYRDIAFAPPEVPTVLPPPTVTTSTTVP